MDGERLAFIPENNGEGMRAHCFTLFPTCRGPDVSGCSGTNLYSDNKLRYLMMRGIVTSAQCQVTTDENNIWTVKSKIEINLCRI